MTSNLIYKILKQKLPLNYCSAVKPLTGNEKLSPLPKFSFDGQEIEFLPGETIMQAAERAGLTEAIPRFCYHPGLPVAGTCRMCAVEIEKTPKLQTACSTPAAQGMVVKSANERVNKSHKGVMEFLLTNHPLDCPVCDQAGECELQDFNYDYGPNDSRFEEKKRVFEKSTTRALSPKIMLNMNRCVNCERCVRFEETVTETYDLLMLNRGWKKELTVSDEEKGLTSDYQGCLADICPVGALTLRDFRFQKRVWFLEKKPSLCDGCSKGCNIEVHHEKNTVYRYTPLFNEAVNQHWMCDEGRLSYHLLHDPKRITAPRLGQNEVSWNEALKEFKGKIQRSENTVLLVGSDSTIEEIESLKKEIKNLSSKAFSIFSFNGTQGLETSTQDTKLDKLLRMKDKTPNTRGLEALGITPYRGEDADLMIVFKNGRATPPAIGNHHVLITWGVWSEEELSKLKTSVHFSGLMTQEKGGSFINSDGRRQGFEPAIVHQGRSLAVVQIFSMLQKL